MWHADAKVNAPPMQNPMTPTRPLLRSWVRRKSTPPPISRTARSVSSSVISFPASSASFVDLPWYRSGASARNPASASRCRIDRMWSFRPHHSWISTTAGT